MFRGTIQANSKYTDLSKEVAVRDIGEAAALLSKNVKLLRIEKDNNFYWLIFENKSTYEVCNLYRFGSFIVDAKSYYENLIKVRKILSNHPNLNVAKGQCVTGG